MIPALSVVTVLLPILSYVFDDYDNNKTHQNNNKNANKTKQKSNKKQKTNTLFFKAN